MKEDKSIKLIKETILHLTDCDNLQEALEDFESKRHSPSILKELGTKEAFNELSQNQIAILFKLLLDLGEVQLKDNVLYLSAGKRGSLHSTK